MDAFGWAVVGSVAGVAGVIVAIVFGVLPYFRDRRVARQALEVSQQGQMSDRYNKAVKQLGSGKLDVRIGGILALARMAADSAPDHPAVMELLGAFIREHSRKSRPRGSSPQWGKVQADVQAAVTVIGDRDSSRDRRPIDLTQAYLAGADLPDANLRGAQLSGVNFRGAWLAGADLADTCLFGADFENAMLSGADMRGANLREANFTNAKLANAVLSGADLQGAKLDWFVLSAADIAGAVLAGATYPDMPPPRGWVRDPESGKLHTADPSQSPA